MESKAVRTMTSLTNYLYILRFSFGQSLQLCPVEKLRNLDLSCDLVLIVSDSERGSKNSTKKKELTFCGLSCDHQFGI